MNKKHTIDYLIYIISYVPKQHQQFFTKLYKYRENHKLFSLIKKFTVKRYRNAPSATIDRMINYIVHCGKNQLHDSEILLTIASKLNKYVNVKSDSANFGRSMSRIADISKHLKPFIGSQSYLDIGCSEGDLTYPIGSYLEVPSENIHGCDIVDCGDHKFKFTTASAEHLPYGNNTFPIISMIMSLHHFPNPKQALKEAKRVLTPGGILIIREHDCDSDQFDLFLDFVHYMYAIVINNEITLRKGHEKEDLDNNKNRIIANYRSKHNWNQEITNAGFIRSKYIRPKYPDMFRSYYALYKSLP
jgi:ubiquinone/menaquinone biosynthesis C-methylase UbiE